MKTYGNLILMPAICIVIFWVFMALLPANAAGCPQCYGDGFPHPAYNQPVSPQKQKCIAAAVARYRSSTTALEAAVIACRRYR
jgi:hypothetical protein